MSDDEYEKSCVAHEEALKPRLTEDDKERANLDPLDIPGLIDHSKGK